MNTVESLEITILADNAASPPYRAEHGFSAFLDLRGTGGSGSSGGSGENRVVLFDTGMGAIFANAASAGVDLSRVTDVVLSHGHYDHTDALSSVLARSPDVRVHASAGIFRDHYSMKTGVCRKISLSEENRCALAALPEGLFAPFSGNTTIAGALVGLAEGITLKDPLELPSPLLFADSRCRVPDSIPDELVLWMETDRGLVILTGCCHAGFVNTCECVRALAPDKQILAVIGGFHLAGVPEDRLASTADYILSRDIERVIPCHCTGDAEIDWLAKRLGPCVTKGSCGMRIRL